MNFELSKSNFASTDYIETLTAKTIKGYNETTLGLFSKTQHHSIAVGLSILQISSDLCYQIRLNDRDLKVGITPKAGMTASEIAFAIVYKLYDDDLISETSLKSIKGVVAADIDFGKFDVSKYLKPNPYVGAGTVKTYAGARL